MLSMSQALGPNPYADMPVPALTTPVKGQCSYKCVRKEFHNASDTEKSKFIWAIRKLMESNGSDYSPWEQMAREHFYYASLNHSSKSFFPWHRLFIAKLESMLQKVDSSVCLLYWDWSYESQNWKQSEVWSQNMLGMGGNGVTQCITGPFSDIRLRTATHPSGCISRGFGESVFYGTSFLTQAHNQYDTYKDWAEYWEPNPHAVVHRYVGGDMQTQYSPNDPVFYLHHGTVDMYYWKFQGKLASLDKLQYDGLTNGLPVSMEDVLVPYPNQVKDMMKIDDYCYTYENYDMAAERNISEPNIPIDFLKNSGFSDEQIRQFTNNSQFNKVSIDNALLGNVGNIPNPSTPQAGSASEIVDVNALLMLLLFLLKLL
eukprot:NODE_158_length_16653_cov_0.456929.p4 type:complete len:372 gc:universal NODE_158_length_16653_cov_0.456929:5741-4626(-)